MAIGSLSSWTFFGAAQFGAAVRIDDDHVFLTMGKYSNVIFCDTDTIDVPNANADSGAENPSFPWVRAFLVAPFKVVVLYYVFNRYIKGYIATLDSETYEISLGDVVTLRDSADNTPFTDIIDSETGPMIQSGDQVQLFWTERDTVGEEGVQRQTMTVDCTGTEPVAGAVSTFSTVEDPLFGRGGVLYSATAGQISSNSLDPSGAGSFTFGGTPGGFSGAGYFLEAVQLPGNLAIGVAGTEDIYALNAAGMTEISPPTPTFYPESIDQLQTRTCIVCGGTKVARLVLTEDSIFAVDEEADGFAGDFVLAVRADKSRALLFQAGISTPFVELIGPVPTDDPFPYGASGSRLWMYKGTISAQGGVSWVSRGVKTNG